MQQNDPAETDRGGYFTPKRVPWVRYVAIAIVIICVHFVVMYFLLAIHILVLAGTGHREISFDSPDAVMTGIGPVFLAINLPLIPWFLVAGRFNPFLGGVAWAATLIVILEAWRRFRRHRMAINTSRATGDSSST